MLTVRRATRPYVPQVVLWQLRCICVGRDHSQAFIVRHDLTICRHGDLRLQLTHADLRGSKAGQKGQKGKVETLGTG